MHLRGGGQIRPERGSPGTDKRDTEAREVEDERETSENSLLDARRRRGGCVVGVIATGGWVFTFGVGQVAPGMHGSL